MGPDGRRKTLRATLPATASPAEIAAAEADLMAQVGRVDVDGRRLPLADVVALFIDNGARKRARKTTQEYRGLLDRWIAPHPVGRAALHRLTTYAIDRHYLDMSDTVGDTTIRRTHSLVHSTLRWSVAMGFIGSNPAASCQNVPRARRTTVTATRPEDWRKAIEGADEVRDGLAALLLVIGSTGVRKSEALALRWSDVDIGTSAVRLRITATLSVVRGDVFTKDTKTHAVRTVVGDAEVARALERRRRMQIEACLAHEYNDFAETNYVWSRHGLGEVPWRPDTAGHWITSTGVKAGELRHMVATQLMRAGLDAVAVASVLGHASPKMTLDVYAEATDDAATRAAAVMSGLAT